MNEIKLINVGGVDQNVKDQYARDIIAPSENGLDSSTNLPVSSRHYDEGAYLIGQDRKYYEAIDDINVGDTLVVGTNIRETTVTEEILMLKGQSANVAIECMADMETTATASKAFATGKYVYWNYGESYGMYEVIADIAQGDAFTTSGASQNIKRATKLGDDISILRNTTTNPNLLDNPWFTVNQRGSSNYTELNKYSLDRWKITGDSSSLSITTNSNGVVATASGGNYTALGQSIEKTAITLGREYTLSVMFVDGTVIKGTGLVSDVNVDTRFISTNSYINKVQAILDYDAYNSLYLCRIFMTSPVSNIAIKAVKLELGSRSTLANDVAPNYAEELLKCQRYFIKINTLDTNNRSPFVSYASSDSFTVGALFPVEMRADPVISNIKARDFFLQRPIISSGIYGFATKQGVMYFQSSSLFTNGAYYFMQFEASADL